MSACLPSPNMDPWDIAIMQSIEHGPYCEWCFACKACCDKGLTPGVAAWCPEEPEHLGGPHSWERVS